MTTGPGLDLAAALREIAQGKGRPVYLVRGEEYLCHAAARELAHALVPEANRDLNLVELDAAVGPSRVAEELRTVPMFRGTKVVWVEPAEFLAPRRPTRGDPLAKVRELWADGRAREATRRLLALAVRAGFGLDGLDARTASEWEAAGFPLGPGDRELFASAVALAQAEGLALPEGNSLALEALLTAGLPPGHHLIAVASEVDAAAPLVRLCRASGLELERSLSAPAERGKQGPPDVRELVAEQLGPIGKSISADAARLLVSRAGRDARILAGELAKLANYLGERPRIEAQDVLELVPQTVGEDFFALSNALERRDGRAMLEALYEEQQRGSEPLKVLAGLASAVRRLLTMRALLGAEGVARALSYPEFERRVFPKILQAEKRAGRKAPNAYGASKRAEACLRFSRDELALALALIAEADLGIKRGMEPRGWLTRICLRLAAAPSPAPREAPRRRSA